MVCTGVVRAAAAAFLATNLSAFLSTRRMDSVDSLESAVVRAYRIRTGLDDAEGSVCRRGFCRPRRSVPCAGDPNLHDRSVHANVDKGRLPNIR